MNTNSPNSDDEWEEESLVVAELSGLIDKDWMEKIGTNCKVLGLDSDQPILKLDRYIFCGEYKDAIGSLVLFEKFPDPEYEEAGDDDDEVPCKLKYAFHTHKRLEMQRVFVTKKAQHDLTDSVGGSAQARDLPGKAEASAEERLSPQQEEASTSHIHVDGMAPQGEGQAIQRDRLTTRSSFNHQPPNASNEESDMDVT